jgi:hypothetical protein
MKMTSFSALLLMVCVFPVGADPTADDPPTINPFGRKSAIRDDAVPGYIELSDGTILPGHIHATRDTRLKIADKKLERQREVPFQKIKKIQCDVEKEWMEAEWRFRENANDIKVYTGRKYPARIYVHTITLSDDRKIQGGLSGVIYLQNKDEKTKKFELHKRGKGKIGADLDSLVYVRGVYLGPDAFEEGKKRLKEKLAKEEQEKGARVQQGKSRAIRK